MPPRKRKNKVTKVVQQDLSGDAGSGMVSVPVLPGSAPDSHYEEAPASAPMKQTKQSWVR